MTPYEIRIEVPDDRTCDDIQSRTYALAQAHAQNFSVQRMQARKKTLLVQTGVRITASQHMIARMVTSAIGRFPQLHLSRAEPDDADGHLCLQAKPDENVSFAETLRLLQPMSPTVLAQSLSAVRLIINQSSQTRGRIVGLLRKELKTNNVWAVLSDAEKAAASEGQMAADEPIITQAGPAQTSYDI